MVFLPLDFFPLNEIPFRVTASPSPPSLPRRAPSISLPCSPYSTTNVSGGRDYSTSNVSGGKDYSTSNVSGGRDYSTTNVSGGRDGSKMNNNNKEEKPAYSIVRREAAEHGLPGSVHNYVYTAE